MTVGARFADDGRSQVSLGKAQRIARAQVLEAISSGFYQLQKRPCQLCGSDDFEPIAEKDRYGMPLKTGLCRHCGLLQTTEVMRPQDYDHFYAEIYRRLYSGRLPPAKLYRGQTEHGREFLKLAKTHIDGFAPCRVLEIGCGAGGILASFQAAGHKVTGYDLDEQYLSYGRSQGLDLRNLQLSAIPDGDVYDLVIVSHLLEHVFDLRQSLRDIRRLIALSGHLIVEVPGLFSISEARYQLDLLLYLQNAHLIHFTREFLFQFLAEEGYEPLWGDEFILAIFRGAKSHSVPPRPRRFEEVRAFLDAIEAKRLQLWRLWLGKVRHKIRRLPGGIRRRLRRLMN